MKPYLQIILLLCAGCAPLQPAGVSETNSAESPRVLTAIVELTSEKSDLSVDLQQVLLAEGRLKEDYGTSPDPRPDALFCTFLDNRRRPLRAAVVDNPLNERLEYADEEGRPRQVIVERESAIFSLRTRYSADLRYLQVDYLDKQEKRKKLGVLALEKISGK